MHKGKAINTAPKQEYTNEQFIAHFEKWTLGDKKIKTEDDKRMEYYVHKINTFFK